jgi:hypothetical protein
LFQTSRSITPVSQRGISGGGDLSADRTIELSASQLGSATLNTTDKLILFDANDSDIPKKFTAQDIFDTISGAVTIYSNTGDNRVLTSGGGTTINGESGLTYDTSTLAVTGDLNISGYVYDSDSGNRLTLDDDTDSAQANQVTLASVNNVNILIDGTNNGTGNFQVRSRPTTANDLDTADIIVDIDETTAIFDNITSQQFKIGGASRTTINESGLKVENSSLGVGQNPPSVNGSAHISNLLRVGTNGEVALTVNDGGGNANVTFNHTSKVPDTDGNSGRIEVNVDGSGGQYMAFELAGNVTSGVSVSTTEIARINSTGLQSSLSGTAASPALRVNDSDTGFYRIADNKLGISTAGTFAVAVDASQNVGIGTSTPGYKLQVSGGDIAIDVGERLYFGGGNHTYISEDIDDRLRFFVGGAEMFRLNEINDFASFFTDVAMASGDKLYLMVGTHTYIDEPSGDQLRLVAGGTEVLKGYSSGTIDIYGGNINRSIELGANRTGDAASYIDFIGDTTYTDYGFRSY